MVEGERGFMFFMGLKPPGFRYPGSGDDSQIMAHVIIR